METSRFVRAGAGCAVVLAVALMAGCASQPVSSRLPETKTDPLCEKVIAKAMAIPSDRWGEPGEKIAPQVVRWPSREVRLACGVGQPGPSPAGCLSANGVDWLEVSAPESANVTFVTYVRAPAVQVEFPRSPSNAINVLGEMSDLVRDLPELKSCT